MSKAAEAGLFHPSIVEPIAAGVEGTVAYRAEEYVAAETLDVAMRHIAPAPLDKSLPIITQLAGAIDFARAAGVGHGALHPRDVFVTPEETRATGFGVVDGLERVGIRAPVRRPYSAPERIEGGPWGTAADVFSLGAIAYELLSGKRPSGTGSEIGALPGATGDAPSGLGAVLDVLTTAMDPNPARRHQTALAFASALERAARGDASGAAATLPQAQPGADPAAAEEDDIAPERDEDAAHHNLIMREQELGLLPARGMEPPSERGRAWTPAGIEDEAPLLAAVGGPAGEDPEAEADRLMLDAAAVASDEPSARFQEDFGLGERAPAVPLGRAVGAAPVYSQPGAIVPERRSRALPLIAMLSLGLLVGFAVGYGVGMGTSKPESQSGTPAATAAEYSEEAVARPAPAAPDPAAAAAGPAAPPSTPAETPRETAAAPRAPAGGRLVVDSIPPRAGVMVNGRWRGRTPLNLDQLPFGRHTLRVVQPGYVASNQNFTLSASDPIEVLSVRLQRQEAARAPQLPARGTRTVPARTAAAPASRSFTGSIYVDSRPRGARVLLDGRPVGTTPVSVPEVRIGAHVVRLELPDHRPWSSSTRVAAGEVARVTGSLERIQ